MPVHTSHIKRQHAIWLRPIVPPLLMYMAGITIGVQAPGYRTSAVIIALVGTGLWLWRWSRSRIGAAVPLGLVGLVGYVAIQPWIVPWLPDTHVIHFAGKGRYTLYGEVTRRASGPSGRQRLVLNLHRLEKQGRSVDVTGKVKVTILGEDPLLQIGDCIAFEGRIKRLRNFNNPGAFDYQRYMAFKSIWVSSYGVADHVRHCQSQKGPHWP